MERGVDCREGPFGAAFMILLQTKTKLLCVARLSKGGGLDDSDGYS